ncbi:Synemin [Camelus dromedarius]|uniref:Synemin n=1 Tax=Camelus dromedarius TaxID=9838 RepID=A0A5N4CEB3_CAMDR|nr:Synemin [Camelus dromedarius]
MLSWRLHTGSEKAELQELNARLYDYVCRVRDLERENLLLEEELRSRRGHEGLWAEAQARFAEEARGLRQQLDELSWATALAEGEREALRRELSARRLRAAGGRVVGRPCSLYEDEVRELEEVLRRGQESQREAEEETRLCAQEAEGLRREALELEQLRALLEDELLRMREEYELQARRGRSRVIASMEDEKAALTLAMADRLRDYQELLQVKTSLSLEVATYRALLEGESNPEILILTERIENVPQGDSMTETIAENIVSSILKQFTHSPETEASASAFPDTKVTYVDRQELPGDGKTKTEIVVESKLTEEVDVLDETGLDYLLNQGTKEVGLKGKAAERVIGDIINLGLKGREGRAKVVNVEIIEEPMSYVGGEKAAEFSTPFQVEEVEDASPGSKGLVEEEEGYEEADVTFSGSRHKKARPPQEDITHVEEVMEAGDSEGEQSYFVSTPDEQPAGRDGDEGSVYGQIHIEEESTIRYSWQDEIVPGSWRRGNKDEALGEKVVKPPDVPEPFLEGDLGSTHWKEPTRSGEFHTEPIVIEKEIKIPQEFHTSIKEGFKEPRHQLVEVIEQLEESLPERMKEELSALTREDQGGPEGVSVDVKKVQTAGGGSVTLVAEVNLLQTVDADQLDLEELSKDEAGEIEKAVEAVVRDSLAKRHSPAPGSPDEEAGAEAPAAGFRFKRWATRELYSPSGEDAHAGPASPGPEQVASQGPVSATVEVTSPRGFAQSQVLEDVTQSVELEVREASVDTEAWTGSGTSTMHVRVGSQRHQTTEQIVPPPWEFSDSESSAHSEGGADVSQATRSYTVGRKILMTERSTFQGAGSPQETSVGDTSGVEVTSGMSRSFRHIQLGPTETQTSEHIVFHGPVSTAFALAGSGDSPELGEVADGSRTVRHVALGPKETSFTFQMDVSNVEATPRWTQEATVLFPQGTEAEAHSESDRGTWRDAGSRNDLAAGASFQGSAGDRHQAPGEKGKEQAEFDKTVQLQRMVDQRSVISDEKKVALLYLDSQDEENEGHWF